MLTKQAHEKIEGGLNSCQEVHLIMQGHRPKGSKDLYNKIRKALIERKDVLFNKPKEGASEVEFKKWADDLVNTFFSVYTNHNKRHTVYREYFRENIDELLVHYEHDLCDAAQYLDSEGITRMSQALYLMKSKSFENIWWRIENRIHDLAEQKDAFDPYNLSTIIRSFSKSQHNRMSGSPKLFYHLEPLILAQIDKIDSRQLSNLMYGYSARSLGNPEIYTAFEKRLTQMID